MACKLRINTWGLQSAPRFVALLIAVPLCSFASARADGRISIQLREQVSVLYGEVRLADISVISGASPQETARISAVDVIDVGEAQTETTISQERVRLRLLLAGWHERQLELSGAELVHVAVTRTLPWSDLRIEQAIQKVLAQSLGQAEEELQVRLSAPFLEILPASMQSGNNWRPDPLPPLRPGLGHLAVTVRLWRGDQLVGARLAHCDVLRRFQVPVAASALEQLRTLQQDDLRMEERFLAQPPFQSDPKQLAGQRLRVPVQRGEVITDRHLMPQAPAAEVPLIRPRDQVPVVARSGAVQVTMQSAEALQSGQVGDVIRLRNPTSDKIISGKVLADGRVEIVLR